MSSTVFVLVYAFEVLGLRLPTYDWTTFFMPVTWALAAAVVSYAFAVSLPASIGTNTVVCGTDVLNLIRAVDKVWEKPGIRYYLRIFSLLSPFAVIAFPVLYFVLVVSSAKISFELAVALVALVIAVGSLGFQLIGDVDARVRDITEGSIFDKVAKDYSLNFQPMVRAVIRRRYKTPKDVKLEDLYNLDHSLFESHVLLENLLD